MIRIIICGNRIIIIRIVRMTVIIPIQTLFLVLGYKYVCLLNFGASLMPVLGNLHVNP